MNKTHITAVTEVYGSGQKIIAAIIEYPSPVLASSVSPLLYKVENRSIIEVSVSETFRGPVTKAGRFVELSLDIGDPGASTLDRIGAGRFTRISVKPASLTVSQPEPLKAANGEIFPPFTEEKTCHAYNGIADLFVQDSFSTGGKTLRYNIYEPKNGEPGKKYPLVLFMHDAGSCSDDVHAALAQGSGAVVWARDAEMGKRPCFVIAPQYPEVCANDEFEVTWQAEATVELINNLTEKYPIDTSRIYGTGQSMGCMLLCEMLLTYPGFFAGSLLVAGQWDPNRMGAARNQNIWAVVAAGDEKAFPIMGACFDSMENAGGKVSRRHLDARADAAILEESVRRQKAEGCNLNFTWFIGKTILAPNAPEHSGAHHTATWEKAYDIEALREWLFEKRIDR